MSHLVNLVSDRIAGADGAAHAGPEDLAGALREAERLSDLYSDVVPKPYTVSANGLFHFPGAGLRSRVNASGEG